MISMYLVLFYIQKGGFKMNCSVCGATYADGQPVCPNCGAPAQPVQQPMNPGMAPMGQSMNQMGGYQRPMAQAMVLPGGMNGFINSLKTDYMKLIGLIGALLIAISPFFTWYAFKLKSGNESVKRAYNLFRCGDKMDAGILTFCGIMFILMGVVLILWEMSDYVPSFANIKAKVVGVPYIELILVGIVLLFFLLAFFNGEFSDILEAGKDSIKEAKKWEYLPGKVSGYSKRGIGSYIALIGVIAVAFPKVIKTIKK